MVLDTHTDSISLTGLRVFARHGVFAAEREHGQDFLIDVCAWLNLAPSGLSDNVDDTVDYAGLASSVAAAVAADPVNLIETVAERIASVVLSYEKVQRVRVTVHKPQAPMSVPVADAAVTITRMRGL